MHKKLIFILLISTIICLDKEFIFLHQEFETGFLPINQKEDIFYWFFPSLDDRNLDSLVFWLTGGPGCSSTMAVFYENGPFKINQDLTLEFNEYTWSNNTNIVFVDQPVGTGYSRSQWKDFSENEDQVAENFARFLDKFLDKYPEFNNRDIYITGESYAGHYIPAIGKKLVEDKRNLAGVAIGNGWVDPVSQFPAYSEFAAENNLISQKEKKYYDGTFQLCKSQINNKQPLLAFFICNSAVNYILLNGTDSQQFNVYDIRQKCENPPLCYDMSALDRFLDRDDVQDALGTKGRHWEQCNGFVHAKLLPDWLENLSDSVKFLVENNLKVLIYSGDKDFICNWRGGEAWTNNIQWSGQAKFTNNQYQDWTVNDKKYGEYKEFKNLKFLRIYDAGHMVPMDQPLAALKMISDFTKTNENIKQ